MRITARTQPHQDEGSRLDLAAARTTHEREYVKWHERQRRLAEVTQYHQELSREARARRPLH